MDTQSLSFWQLVTLGGWLMIPIGLCSLVGIAYTLERFLALRRRVLRPEGFAESLREAFEKKDLDGAAALCAGRKEPLARVAAAGLREWKASADWDRTERAMEEAGGKSVAALRRNVRVLRVVSEIAPLLGLLGTVQGMMGAFQNISSGSSQIGKTELFAGDIFLALITTAAGLIVAIPALFLAYHFNGRVDKIADGLEDETAALFDRIRPRAVPAPGTPAPETAP